jgi:hypothetical protein
MNCRNKRHKNCFSKNSRTNLQWYYHARQIGGKKINSLSYSRERIPKIKFPVGDFVHTQKAKWIKKE